MKKGSTSKSKRLPASADAVTAPRVGRRARPTASVAPDDPDEIAPEYDFRDARPNPYAARYVAGAMAVVLDPDVAAAFPSAERVNEVLRAVAGILEAPAAPPSKRPRRSA